MSTKREDLVRREDLLRVFSNVPSSMLISGLGLETLISVKDVVSLINRVPAQKRRRGLPSKGKG